MRAAILYTCNEPLRIETLEMSDLQYGQVLVKLAASGICGSQLLEISGKRGNDPYLPHTLGHEGSGIVEAIGPGVSKVKPGDHVIISWIRGSGINAGAPMYQIASTTTKIHSGPVTTFQTHSIISENRLTPIPKEMPLEEAALIGCSVATGVGLAFHDANIKEGDVVAILGVGGIGLNVVQGAFLRKAKKIIALDVHDHKLATAEYMGATHTLRFQPGKGEICRQEILSLTEGRGVDVAIECAGKQETMEMAFEVSRVQGGKAILAGNLQKGEKIGIDPYQLILGKQILGSWGGATNPDRDFTYYVDLFLENKLKLRELISHRFWLSEINEAIRIFQEGKALRVLILF